MVVADEQKQTKIKKRGDGSQSRALRYLDSIFPPTAGERRNANCSKRDAPERVQITVCSALVLRDNVARNRAGGWVGQISKGVIAAGWTTGDLIAFDIRQDLFGRNNIRHRKKM